MLKPEKPRQHVWSLVSCFFLSFALTANAFAASKLDGALSNTVASLEQQTGGRVGISVIDIAADETWSHRGDEPFPITSTVKAFACAHLLDLKDKGKLDASERVRFEPNELQSYSPITKDHVGGNGMSLLDLCDATTATSDNTAANLILRSTGGPEALTRFMRDMGDNKTRLDRLEPDLNVVGPGEVRDTTTPNAAASSLRKLVLGKTLSELSRRQLVTWLKNNRVGGPLLRARLPSGWMIADRTGAGEFGSRSVIAVLWPKADETTTTGPIVIAIYLTGTTLTIEQRNAAIAELGGAIIQGFQR